MERNCKVCLSKISYILVQPSWSIFTEYYFGKRREFGRRRKKLGDEREKNIKFFRKLLHYSMYPGSLSPASYLFWFCFMLSGSDDCNCAVLTRICTGRTQRGCGQDDEIFWMITIVKCLWSSFYLNQQTQIHTLFLLMTMVPLLLLSYLLPHSILCLIIEDTGSRPTSLYQAPSYRGKSGLIVTARPSYDKVTICLRFYQKYQDYSQVFNCRYPSCSFMFWSVITTNLAISQYLWIVLREERRKTTNRE